MLVITALVRLRHEGDCKLKVILVYIERSCLRKPKEVEEEEDDEEEKEAEEEMTEEKKTMVVARPSSGVSAAG